MTAQQSNIRNFSEKKGKKASRGLAGLKEMGRVVSYWINLAELELFPRILFLHDSRLAGTRKVEVKQHPSGSRLSQGLGAPAAHARGCRRARPCWCGAHGAAPSGQCQLLCRSPEPPRLEVVGDRQRVQFVLRFWFVLLACFTTRFFPYGQPCWLTATGCPAPDNRDVLTGSQLGNAKRPQRPSVHSSSWFSFPD